MEPQLQEKLNESVRLTQNLLSLLEQDVDNMGLCVKGEILDEYRKAADMARDKIMSVKRRLIRLQAEGEQRLGM